jgi:HTH-type transcriptional regulator/antitoxin HigA
VGAKAGTRDGDLLDVLATLIDAYEAEHYPMDPPDLIEAIKRHCERRSSRREAIQSPWHGLWIASALRGASQ